MSRARSGPVLPARSMSSILDCGCTCTRCVEDDHCYRQPCFTTQRHAMVLKYRGREIAYIEHRGGDFMFLSNNARGYTLEAPEPVIDVTIDPAWLERNET